MTAQEREELYRRLVEREAELLALGPVRLEQGRRDEGTQRVDEDEAPLTEMLQAIASGRNKALEVELAQVRRALAKWRTTPDMFGLCESCEEPVGEARLQAQPHARYCVPCQSRQDGPRTGHTRKRLTDYR